MAYVEVTPYQQSEGVLREEYDAGIERAGRVWNILSVQSRLPAVLRESMRLYKEVMFGPSPLTRAQRELLAAVTSTANQTRYCTIAHWHDYRDEVDDQVQVDSIMEDWRTADMDEADRALVAFAEKLTHENSTVGEGDIQSLRSHGFDDTAISSAVQVVAYFNYINRVADGLGVDLEDWIDADGREIAVG